MQTNIECPCSNTKVYGLEESIKRAKYPMCTDVNNVDSTLTEGIKKLAQTKMGEGHDNWLTGIVVQFDLTFSVKAWTEAERYHFFDIVSSQSTMHRITSFNLDKSYNGYVDPAIVNILKNKVEDYQRIQSLVNAKSKRLELSVAEEEEMRKELKEKYLEILYSNPCGFQLTAGMTTNYRQLKTIYNQRKNHRLPEWRAFCAWIESLPCSELIIDATQS